MKVKELIKKLEEYNEDKEVLVWAGYNAGAVTSKIEFKVNDNDTITLQ